MPTLHTRPRRRLLTLGCTFVVAAALASTVPSATAQSAPAPHWGNYKWSGGQETANIRAFWLVDRTGDRTAQALIKIAVDAWNGARDVAPELPFIAIYKDDANAGRCFVNRTPGYSVASACMFPNNIHGVKSIAARNADSSGHLVGAAFAISDGLDVKESLTAVCHGLGHVMGLDDSDNEASCMFPTSNPDEAKWYDNDADVEAILGLYDHDENAATTTTSAPTTTTVAPTTTTVAPTTTTVAPTTTTVEPTTTTTLEPTTTTSTTLIDCSSVPLPVGCPL